MRSITKPNSLTSTQERLGLQTVKPLTLWFTGLSGSGKSTIAYLLEKELVKRKVAVFVLDGDNLRHGLSSDLSFSLPERSENIRRTAEVARLMNEAGILVIVALISPTLSDREKAKQIIGAHYFREVYANAELEICEKRDVKGLYKMARKGLIENFTGISSPYQPPILADLEFNSDTETTSSTIKKLLRLIF